MVTILLLVGLLLAGAGLLSLSQATLGIGLIGLACFCGITARLIQADHQHREEAKRREELWKWLGVMFANVKVDTLQNKDDVVE